MVYMNQPVYVYVYVRDIVCLCTAKMSSFGCCQEDPSFGVVTHLVCACVSRSMCHVVCVRTRVFMSVVYCKYVASCGSIIIPVKTTPLLAGSFGGCAHKCIMY